MSLGNKRAAAWSGPIGNMCVDKDARPRTSAREPPQERVRPPACAPPKLSLETLSHSRGRPPSMLSMDCVPLSPPLLVHAFHTTLSHTLPVFVIQLSLLSHTPAYPLPMHLSPSLSLPLLPSPSLSLSRPARPATCPRRPCGAPRRPSARTPRRSASAPVGLPPSATPRAHGQVSAGTAHEDGGRGRWARTAREEGGRGRRGGRRGLWTNVPPKWLRVVPTKTALAPAPGSCTSSSAAATSRGSVPTRTTSSIAQGKVGPWQLIDGATTDEGGGGLRQDG